MIPISDAIIISCNHSEFVPISHDIESAHFSTRNLHLFHKWRKETPFQILSDNRPLSEACQAICTRLFEYTGVESKTFAVRKCAFRFFEFHPCKRWPARSSVLIETREWRFVACRANRWLAVITDRTGNDWGSIYGCVIELVDVV